MANAITYQQFLEVQSYYYQVLKKGYLREVVEADDKEYASKHFQKILFEENEMVPQHTVLFEEFLVSYKHLSRIKAEKGFYQTVVLIKEIREISKKELTRAIEFQKGKKGVGLCDWYIQGMQSKSISLEKLIENETGVLEFTDENLIAALALKLAGSKLLKEFHQKDTPLEPTSHHRYKFTQKEQLLCLSYILESLGVNLLGQCDRTKLAALFHLIMGVSFDDKKKLKDLGIYKSLAIFPQVVKDDKVLLKYLENIKPYLQEANFSEAVLSIDQQIQRCRKELE